MYGMYFLFVVFLYCNLLQLTKVEGLLLPFLYIHTCVIFNKCIQTLKKKNNNNWTLLIRLIFQPTSSKKFILKKNRVHCIVIIVYRNRISRGLYTHTCCSQ